MQLIKNPKFLEEYKSWNDKISKITNQEKKDKVSNLIKKLVQEIKKIDAQHNDLTISQGVSESLKDSRENISKLRKKIYSELES